MLKPALSHEHPIAMAHRGSRTLWPENTMEAFQAAIDLGYRYLETDVHSTSDGVVVCFHDPTLDRTTDAIGPVSQRHFADLKSLDAGYRFDRVHHFPYRGRGVTIPSLEEVMKTFPEAVVTIDLKQAGIEQLVATTIERLGVNDRLIVGAFKENRVRKFRKLTHGRVATAAGPRETIKMVFGARAGRSMNIAADVLQVPEKHKGITVVDHRVVQAAHRRGKQVHVWTVNDPDEMARLLDLGVDGIVTDRPDLLKELLASRSDDWTPENA